jgi:hypothetical protein
MGFVIVEETLDSVIFCRSVVVSTFSWLARASECPISSNIAVFHRSELIKTRAAEVKH